MGAFSSILCTADAAYKVTAESYSAPLKLALRGLANGSKHVDVELQEGTLRMSGDASLGNGNLDMSSGATLELATEGDMEVSKAISGSGTIVKVGDNAVTLAAQSSDWSGQLEVQGGSLSFGEAGSFVLDASRTLTFMGEATLASDLTPGVRGAVTQADL